MASILSAHDIQMPFQIPPEQMEQTVSQVNCGGSSLLPCHLASYGMLRDWILLGEEAHSRQRVSGEAGLHLGSRFSTVVGHEVLLSQEHYLMQVSSRTELSTSILGKFKEQPEWRGSFSRRLLN